MSGTYKEVNHTNTVDVDDVNIGGPIIQQQPQKTGFNSLQADCIENKDASLLNETNTFRNPWDTSGRTVTSIVENHDIDPKKEKEKEKQEPPVEVHNTFCCLYCPGGPCYCGDCGGDTVDGVNAINNQDGCCGDQDGCCGGQDCECCDCGDCDCAGDCGGCDGGDCACGDCACDCGSCTIL